MVLVKVSNSNGVDVIMEDNDYYYYKNIGPTDRLGNCRYIQNNNGTFIIVISTAAILNTSITTNPSPAIYLQ